MELSRKPKVIYTDISLECGKPAKTYRGIIAHRTLIVQKRMWLLGEQYAELKKGHLRDGCNQDWTKIGGSSPLNVSATFKIFRTNCLMGRHHTKGDLVNHLKGPSFRLVHWLKKNFHIHERSVKNPSIWKESTARNLPRLCIVRARIWKGDILVVDFEELEEMDAS